MSPMRRRRFLKAVLGTLGVTVLRPTGLLMSPPPLPSETVRYYVKSVRIDLTLLRTELGEMTREILTKRGLIDTHNRTFREKQRRIAATDDGVETA